MRILYYKNLILFKTCFKLLKFTILATPDNHCLIKNFEGGPIEIRMIINNGILAVEYSISEDTRYPNY
jgi:hypothetical protein